MYRLFVEEFESVWFAVALVDDGKIGASCFSLKDRGDAISSLVLSLPVGSSLSEGEPNKAAQEVLRNMNRLYQGEPVKSEFKFDMERLSPFTKRVLYMTLKIPRGYVASYSGIAAALGDKAAARAVGNIEAANPFSPIVPCHRVVNSNLELGGYSGGFDAPALAVKRSILKREGVIFSGNRISRESLWTPKNETASLES